VCTRRNGWLVAICFLCAVGGFAVRWPSSASAHAIRPSLVGTVPIASSHPTKQDVPISLPVAANGRMTPEAIPIEVAEHHFVRAIAISRTSSAVEQQRQRRMMASIGLSDADRRAFLAAVDGVGDELQALASKRRDLSSLARQDEVALVRSTLNRARSTLTKDGVARLERYIKDDVRRKIVIYHRSDD